MLVCCRKLTAMFKKLEEITYTKETVPALMRIEQLLNEQEAQLQLEIEQASEGQGWGGAWTSDLAWVRTGWGFGMGMVGGTASCVLALALRST
jgi:hypothetical protein